MKKYHLSFEIFDKEEQAKAFCDRENSEGNYYKRKNRRAHFAPWTDSKQQYHGFIAWYYI